MEAMERRLVLKGFLVSSAVLATPVAALAGTTPQGSDDASSDASTEAHEQWELLAPIGPGSDLGGGWSAKSLSAVSHGAAVLTIAHLSGTNARVHVCRRAGAPRGVAHTERLDLLLMNGGDGSVPTDEDLSRAVKTVALRISRQERQATQPRPKGLLPHPARLGWYGRDGVLE